MSVKKNKAWYRAALMGVRDKRPGDYQGLRSYARDFSAAAGFDLNHFDEWSPGMKAKVTRYFDAVQKLTSRSHHVFRARNATHLEQAQRVAQHPAGLPALKVAFIPYSPPKGREDEPPQLRFTKTGVVVHGPYYDRKLLPFNRKALVRNPEEEIARTIAGAHGAKTFLIQAGEFEISRGYDAVTVTKQVKMLMAQYDGRSMPKSSQRRNDNPKQHHWKHWLNGLVAYSFERGGDPQRLLRDMEKARNEKRKSRSRERAQFAREYYLPLASDEYYRQGGRGAPDFNTLNKTFQDQWIRYVKQKYGRRKHR